MAKKGQNSKYYEKYDELAYIFCSENAFTDKKLALAFDVSEKTINTWKKEHPTFLQSIKRGKDEWNSDAAEKSLMKRVKGFSFTETTKEAKFDEESGTTTLKVTKKVRKHLPPDPTSIIFFLKNRRPDRWRDRKDHTLSGPDGGPIQYTEFPSGPLTLEEWQAQVEALNQDKPDSAG